MTELMKYLDEIRFVWELIAAVNIFAVTFTRKKDRFISKIVVTGIVITGISAIYPSVILESFDFSKMGVLTIIVNVGWYTLLTLLTGVSVYCCYELTKADTIFLCAQGYALQHIEFILVNEIVGKGIWPSMDDNIFFYIFICASTSIIFFGSVYLYVSKNLRSLDGHLLDDSSKNIAIVTIMFIVIVVCTFMCQTIFVMGHTNYERINYLGAAVDVFFCSLVLGVGYAMCQISSLNREKGIVEQLLYERKRQYQLSKENIDVINRKCHDLKHQIKALENVDASERLEYIEELRKAINIYDSVVNTGNEVVDTILSEKSLNCESRNIRLSCICDASYLDFMSTLDIYALLGNALDNAIENVSKFKDEKKRVISLNISAVGDFLSIQTSNYCDSNIVFEDGIPKTSKKNKQYHGYGLKSMKHIAKKYGGSMVCGVEDNTFTLQILLPMPTEFLRLYEIRENEMNISNNK